MEPRIEVLQSKKMVGKSLKMTYSNDKTGELWKSFMIRRKEITNAASTDLFSIQVYDPSYDFSNFNPNNQFEKWAAVEVADYHTIPAEMEYFELKGGLYAVFIHRGGPATGPQTFQYIFTIWLPLSAYSLDNRPHFEILGMGYKNGGAESEEEIWIPIRERD
jgi:AraC family transcriptional regulator